MVGQALRPAADWEYPEGKERTPQPVLYGSWTLLSSLLCEPALPEAAGEVRRRDEVDAVVGAARAGFQADHDPADAGVLISQDAQALQVMAGDPGALSEEAVYRIDAAHRGGGRVAVSPIAFWEAAMLNVKAPGAVDATALRARVLARGITEAPLTSEVAITAALLGTQGFLVKDPADRFIAATAMRLGYELATTDRAILNWEGPLRCIDARP